MSSLYTIDQMKWLSDRFAEDDFTPELVNMFGQAGNLRRFKAVLEDRAEIRMISSEAFRAALFRLAVNWNRTTEEMLRAGRYDWADKNITEDHFPRPQTSGVVEGQYRLFHFDRRISSDDTVRGMGPEWTPAGPHETLAYGEKFPEIQRQFPIVGLGDPVWRRLGGLRCVVVLGVNVSDRGADLVSWEGDWGSGYRFLARRK